MEARTQLLERLRRAENPLEAIITFEREAIARNEDAAIQSRALFDLGRVSEDFIADRKRALGFYQQAWKLDPSFVDPLSAARRMYGELGRREMVAELGEAELKLSPDPDPTLLLLVGEALLDCRKHERAVAILLRAAKAVPDGVEIAEALAVATATSDGWQAVADDFQQRAKASAGVDAARLLLQAARTICQHQSQSADIDRLLNEALALDPNNESASYLLETRLVTAKRVDEIHALHERRGNAHDDSETKARFFGRMAFNWQYRLDDGTRAAEFFTKALRTAFGNGKRVALPAVAAGTQLVAQSCGSAADYEKYLADVDLCLDYVEADTRVYVASQAARAAWAQLQDVERTQKYLLAIEAVDELAPILTEFASDQRFNQELAGKTTVSTPTEQSEGKQPETAPDVAATQAAATSPSPAAADSTASAVPSSFAPPPDEEISDELQQAMDAASALEAESPDKAMDAWRKVVQKEPDKLTPRHEYIRVLRDAGRWNQLVEALKDMEAKAATEPDAKVTVLRELARVYSENLRNDVQAMNTLAQMVKLQPGNLTLYDELAEAQEAKKRWPDLVKTLNQKAEQIHDNDALIALRLRIATLYKEQFNNQAEAIKAFEKVLELDPNHVDAIDSLLAVYEKRRDWEKLITLREREIDNSTDAEERMSKIYDVAKLASTKVKKPDICITWWEKVLDHEPHHPEAIAELFKLYERSKDWEKLAHICSLQAESADDPAKQVESLQKLGLLYTDKLQDTHQAISAWRRLLDVDPNHRRAQDSIKKLYIAEENWDDLEDFYRQLDKLDEYVRVLERQLDAEGAGDKLPLALKIAGIYERELEKPDRAMRAYERVLTIDSSNRDAAEALIPLYEKGRDPRKLVTALEIQLEHTDSPGERQERIRRLAQLSEEKLRDAGLAFDYWLKAYEEEHTSADIREELERLVGEADKWSELVGLYQKSYDRFSDANDALPLMLVVAKAQEEQLGQLDQALATNKAIHEIDDSNEDALNALERLYIGQQQYDELLTIFRRRLELTHDGEQQKDIYSRMGQLYEEEINDDDEAIKSYVSILDLVADDLDALRALDRLYNRSEKWQELHDILEHQISVIPGEADSGGANPQFLELKYRLGQLREHHLSDEPGAIEAYSDVLAIDSSHDQARAALEPRMQDGPHATRVAGILEPIFEELEDWKSLINVYEVQLKGQDDSFARVGLLMQIGELYSKRLGDAENAFEAFSRAFREDPTSAGAKDELEELCNLLDHGWKILVGLYEDAIDSGNLDPGLQHEFSMKVARAYVERLDDADKAVRFYKTALRVEPDDMEAIGALEQIFTQEERYPELLEIYRKKADVSADVDERLRILFKVATLHEEMLNHPEDALSVYNEILGHDADNVQAMQALDRLYASLEQWQDLGDNLSRQLDRCDDPAQRTALLLRLAHLREAELGEVAAAIETYRQVLEAEPDNADAVAALEKYLANEDYELAVAQVLEPTYQAASNWQKQVEIYQIMARHAFDPERKLELYHRVAELQELGGDNANAAFETFAAALREEPSGANTQAQLERLARTLGKMPELVVLYDEVVANIGDEDAKTALLLKLAQIYEHEIADDAKAVATYQRVLDVSGDHADAANAIQEIHERNGDHDALVVILKRRAEMTFDVNEKKALLFRAAQMQERVLNNPDGAVETLQKVLELDDLDEAALKELERIYLALDRWEPLKDVYAKLADLAEDPFDKRQHMLVLGQVYDTSLRDVPKAIETYQAILDINPDDADAFAALDRLYTEAERWYDLLQVLERQAELAEYTAEAVAHRHRIGQLWQDKLQDLSRAVDSYRDALALDGSHIETLQALETLMRSGEGEPELAAQVLIPIYETTAEFGKLAQALEVVVTHAEEPTEKIETFHRLAEIYEQSIGEPGRAFDAYARALEVDNGDELSLAQLERLAEGSSNWQALAELYAKQSENCLDVPRQVDLLSRLARVFHDELGKVEEAIQTHKRILDVEFDNTSSILALDRLYTEAGRWDDLVAILRKELQIVDSEEEITSLQFRLGQVLEQQIKDLPAAIEAYREILATDPVHTAAIGALEMLFLEGQHELEIAQVLEPLYETAGEFEKLHRIYEVQLGKLEGVEDRNGMLTRLGELAEHKLLDQQRAFAWWSQALQEDPRSELAYGEAERLATDVGGWDGLAATYIAILEKFQDPDVQRQTRLWLAKVQEERLLDTVQAIETYKTVLQVDAADNDALAALDRLYDSGGMYEELVTILGQRIEASLDGDEIVSFHFRRGRIQADVLGDLEAALACYEAVLEQDTRNRAALEAQEAIYFQQRRWQELFATYEKLVDASDTDDELAGCYARMARISSDALDDEAGAIDLWNKVLDILAEDPMPLESLGEIYARQERWEDYIETLERQVAVTEADTGQIVLYKRLGHVWANKLNRERNALDAWMCADRLNPHDIETLRALVQLHRKTQSWEDLSATLRRSIALAQSVDAVSEDEMIELYEQLGQLEGEILGRVDESVQAWRQVLALDPGNVKALAALEQLFTREARWEECIDILEKKSLLLDDEGERIDTLLQAASIWEEKVGNYDEAADFYNRVRRTDTSNRIASERLEEIYRNQYKWAELTEILLERVEQCEASSERIELFKNVAKIYEEELGDREGAFVVLQAAFKEDYGDEDTAHELERLATAAGKWGELLQEYTEIVQQLEPEDPDAACDLWVKMGRWYGDHLSHVDYAIHSVEQALRINPEHAGALAALADFQRNRGSWSELVETMNKLAVHEQDIDKKVEHYLALGDLMETQLGDAQGAVVAYQNALATDPTCMQALVFLDRLYRSQAMWDALIDVLGRMADLRDEQDEVVRIRLEIGQLWDERLLDSDQAIASYQRVLDADPSNMVALRALEQLYEKTGQSEKYLEVLEAQLDVSPEDNEQVALYARMASAWEERFGKLDRAAECLEKIVSIEPRNYEAHRELARLYRQDRKWDALVDAYRNYIAAVTDGASKVDLYCAMGEVYENELRDPDRAIESYLEVLNVDPNEPRALDSLGRLYEAISDWSNAIDSMSRLVQQTEDAPKQVDLYHRIGRITHANLGDSQRAEEYVLYALQLDDSHLPSLETLVTVYSDTGDWLKAAQTMVKAESYSQNLLDKTRLLYQAAVVYRDKLRDLDQAREYLAAVVALDPEHVEAAEPLAEIYYEGKQWEHLAPVQDMLLRKAQQDTSLDPAQLNLMYYRAGKCADELNEFDKARDLYKAAYDIDPAYLPTLLGRASLLYKMQDWNGAGKLYQTILVGHREAQTDGETVDVYYRLGMVRHKLGERRKAVNMFEKALEIDANHVPTLNAVIDIQADQGDFEAVIHAKRNLMTKLDDAGKVETLSGIGDIYYEKLNNPTKAISTFLEALEVAPDDHQLLQKVLDLYTVTEQWQKSVEVIGRFIDLEPVAIRKGTYYQAAGTICRDKLKSHDQAIENYNKALDHFFADGGNLPESMSRRALKAFQDIDKILTSKKDWKEQERAYRRMIKRLPQGHPILPTLFHGLGEIERTRLRDYKSAIEAFEVAQALDPSNNNRAEILAELYLVAGPDYADKAIARHMEMLKREPFKFDSYKALRKIYDDTRQYDKSWCICNALTFLKKADPQEVQFFEQYKPRGFVKAQSAMNDAAWKRIYHPDENLFIGHIFGTIWQGVASLRGFSYKDLGLRKKDRLDEQDQLLASRMARYVAKVLNVPLPDLYLQQDQPGELIVANILDKSQLIPSLVIRQNILQGRSEKEVAYVVARQMAMMRPEHYLKIVAESKTELKTALLSAIVLCRPDFPIPPDMQANVQTYLPAMRERISPQLLEHLALVVNAFLQNAPEVDMGKWRRGVDATTHRVGLVVCNDLETAARMVSVEPAEVGGPQARDKVKELVIYSISEEYFAVRRDLGLAIG